jgi:hypothetical protein
VPFVFIEGVRDLGLFHFEASHLSEPTSARVCR